MRRKTRKLMYEALFAGVVLIFISLVMLPKFFGAQNINTPKNFPDPNFRAVVEAFMKVPAGGRIPASAVARRVDTLNCTRAHIQDLTGIEYFKNLKGLNCSSNDLRVLDVSRNHALTELDCSQNQLHELFCSANRSLQNLYCHKNNLHSLRLPNALSLKTLSCYENQLTTLDLSSCSNLEKLLCHRNQLSILSLETNPNLILLYCMDNRLRQFDLSPCPKLTFFHCANNQLSTLDVSHTPALQTLHCASNGLQTLDLKNNSHLAELNIQENDLSLLDLRNTKIHSLFCDRNQIEEIHLPEKSSFHFFVCSHNQLNDLPSLLDRFQGIFPGYFDIRYNDFSLEDLTRLRGIMKEMFRRGISTSEIQYWPQNGMEEENIPEEWLSENIH